jgi:hypothetical protein
VAPLEKAKIPLEGGVLNSERTSGVVGEFHMKKKAFLFSSVLAVKTSQKLLKRVVNALR